MPRRSDEIDTSMHPQVDFLASFGLLLLAHVCFMLVVNEFDNGRPGVAVVDVVAKPRRVNDGQLHLELLLLQLGLDDVDFRELVKLLVVAPVVVFWGRQLRREEGVDERRFTESRLPYNENEEFRFTHRCSIQI